MTAELGLLAVFEFRPMVVVTYLSLLCSSLQILHPIVNGVASGHNASLVQLELLWLLQLNLVVSSGIDLVLRHHTGLLRSCRFVSRLFSRCHGNPLSLYLARVGLLLI